MKKITIHFWKIGLFLSLYYFIGMGSHLLAQPSQKQISTELKQQRSMVRVGTTDRSVQTPCQLNLTTSQGDKNVVMDLESSSPRLAYKKQISSDPAASDVVTVVLSVIPSERYGYQMLLDAGHTTYGTTIPSGEYDTRISKGDIKDSVYELFSNRIPANANGLVNEAFVVNPGASDTAYIQAGVYDFCFMYPNTNQFQFGFWAVTDPLGRQDDFSFEAGYTYTFLVSRNIVDFYPPFDLEVSSIFVPKNGILSEAETIAIEVKNNSSQSEVSDYTLHYCINERDIISETPSDPLAANAIVKHSFQTKADLSVAGLYKIKAWVTFTEDLKHRNDTVSAYCKHTQAFKLPFLQTFAKETDIYAYWNILDKNQDDLTWVYEAYSGADETPGYVYYKGAGSGNAADDYLISDAIILPKKDMHISFDCRNDNADAPQKLEVLYGTSPDPEQMQSLIRMDNIGNSSYTKEKINFTPPSEGSFYFAFHVFSEGNWGSLYLDNVSIDTGNYVGIPDIMLTYIDLPLSSCDLNSPTSINVSLANIGDEPIQEFSVHFTINDTIQIDEKYTQFLNSEDSIKVQLWPYPALDFSEKTVYRIKAWVSVKGDENPLNDTVHLRINNYEPITDLPYTNFFTSQENADNWYTTLPFGLAWGYDVGYQTYEGFTDFIPLVSRCFQLEPGTYRVFLTYSAGMTVLGYNAYESIALSCGSSGSDPMSWSPFLILENKLGRELTSSGTFSIDQAGEYALSIMSLDLDGLNMGLTSIFGLSIEKVFDHDLKIQNLSSETLGSLTPAEQLAGTQKFSAMVVNYGNNTAQNIKTQLKNGDDIYGTENSINSLAADDTARIYIECAIPSFEIGSEISLKVDVYMDDIDEVPLNNSTDFIFRVTDSVFAQDRVENFNSGVGANSPISFGNVFTLSVGDTLTSISIGFIGAEQTQGASFSISTVDANGNIGSKIMEKAFARPMEAGIKNFDFQALLLKPARYYFAVHQTSSTNIGIACDANAEGSFMATDKNHLTRITDYGNICIRPVFGHNRSVIQYDGAILGISKPRDYGVFSVNESIVVKVKNNGSDTLWNLPIHCSIDGVELPSSTCSVIPPYSNTELSFTGDLSLVGSHTIKAWLVEEKDQVEANNIYEKIVICKEIPSPYTLNFEYCEDFAINNFIPAWTTLDGDRAGTAQFQAYTFPHAGKPFAYIVFNPLLTNPPMYDFPNLLPMEGEYYGAVFSAGKTANNDWLISPKLKMGDSTSLSMWVKSYVDLYGLESYKVLVSETDSNPNSFKAIGSARTAEVEDWENVNIDLSAYNHKEIYVAIQCVSENAFVFMVDDIQIKTVFGTNMETSEQLTALRMYPNPATNFVQFSSAASTIQSIEVWNTGGRSVYRSGSNLNVSSLSLSTESFGRGIFFVKVNIPNASRVFKLVVL